MKKSISHNLCHLFGCCFYEREEHLFRFQIKLEWKQRGTTGSCLRKSSGCKIHVNGV